jgi:predicted glutamine amidotransferase
MCVIAVKNSGVQFPNDDLMKSMWDSNSDGAGFMYTTGGKVYIEKGFMKYEDLMRAVANLKKKVDIVSTPVILHFRITTHGGTSPHNTHPFPISSNEKYLKALDLTCSLGMVHNGIISSVELDKETKMSDTMTYIQDVLAPLSMLNKSFYKHDFGKQLMENQIGWSKLAFLDKSGNIELVGSFLKGTKYNSKDILFSNLNHEFSRSNIYKTFDTGRTTTELLKAIPVGYYLEGSSAFNTTTSMNVVTMDNIYFVDENNIIYYKTESNKMVDSGYYEKMFIKDASGNMLEATFDDIKSKAKQYEVEISSYGGGLYDY